MIYAIILYAVVVVMMGLVGWKYIVQLSEALMKMIRSMTHNAVDLFICSVVFSILLYIFLLIYPIMHMIHVVCVFVKDVKSQKG